MARSNQNQVPYEFDAFYRPILELKRRLQSNAKELDAEQVIQGFVMLHYATFMMCNLSHTLGVSTAKILAMRELIESIMQKDSFKLEPDHCARISSFIDKLGKELNTTYKPYVYIAMYNAYLDAEIYKLFHSDFGIYDFAEFQYVSPEIIGRMKQYHDVSLKVLEDLKLSPKEQSLVDKALKDML